MALHGRYTNGLLGTQLRIQVKFRRDDLLWRTAEVLHSPYSQAKVHGLPISHDGLLIGPTVLDMMVRKIVPLDSVLPELLDGVTLLDDQDDIAVWELRNPSTLWLNPRKRKKPKKEAGRRDKPLDHPFQPGLASAGKWKQEHEHFVRVEKFSTVSISDLTVKLAVGMMGSVAAAHTHIGKLAADAWERDLERAIELWELIHAVHAGGLLVEDDSVALLRPISSISQEVERDIMRQTCSWLGVDPEMDCSRGRGRPRSDEAGELGDIIKIVVSPENVAYGQVVRDFHNVTAGTDLHDLTLIQSVELLGALRVGEFELDADLLEAYLDGAVPDWREQVAGNSGSSAAVERDGDDPYEILGVSPDTPMKEVTLAYRRIMQELHPDRSKVSRWFVQTTAAAYREIKRQKGVSLDD